LPYAEYLARFQGGAASRGLDLRSAEAGFQFAAVVTPPEAAQ
jgi:hypothetical protein